MKKTYIVPVVTVLALRPLHMVSSSPNVTFGSQKVNTEEFDTKEDSFWD